MFAILLVIAAGCEEDDERLAQYAEESVRQQAGQTRGQQRLATARAADQQKMVTAGSGDLQCAPCMRLSTHVGQIRQR